MADLLQQLEHAVSAALKTLGVEDVQVQVQEVPADKPGDFGTPVAFSLAKVLRRPPVKIAQEILAALEAAGLPPGIARADAVGPYLNFHVDPGAYVRGVVGGVPAPVDTALKVVVEHTSVNPNKEAHVGHLRNIVLGDAVAYGLCPAFGRGIFARHGSWFGYTAERSVRVNLLFERWGSWAVLVTRTFVSYLSAVVSVLAGAGRYRLSAFLAWTVLGRLIGTAAYLGLGYGVGTDLQAAADFLKNLSGLLLSLAVLAAAGLVASGRQS